MIAPLTDRRPARVALLGCGTVGRAVAAHLLDPASPWSARVELTSILVRDPARPRDLPRKAAPLLTDSFDHALATEPEVIIELLGGLDPAAAHIGRVLQLGIPVVTANKTVLAHRGDELLRAAADSGSTLGFEGTVCAGLPVIAALTQLRGDRVLSIQGIISGSCNFILTQLAAGVPFDRAVAEAQSRGLVEPDPSADLSGRDCAEKACILAACAGFPGLTPDRVGLQGIARLTAEDLSAARGMGHTIKLLAELDFTGAAPALRVGPTLLPFTHPLAHVHNEENAVIIRAELAGEIFLRGRGAGPGPTASAVLGDLARVVRPMHDPAPPPRSPTPATDRHAGVDAAASTRPQFMRVRAPAGRLEPAHVFAVLNRHGVSAREVAISRTAAHVLTDGQTRCGAAACAEELAGGESERVLIAPALPARRGTCTGAVARAS